MHIITCKKFIFYLNVQNILRISIVNEKSLFADLAMGGGAIPGRKLEAVFKTSHLWLHLGDINAYVVCGCSHVNWSSFERSAVRSCGMHWRPHSQPTHDAESHPKKKKDKLPFLCLCARPTKLSRSFESADVWCAATQTLIFACEGWTLAHLAMSRETGILGV